MRPCNNCKEKYLLSGKIFCGECSFTMGGNKKLSGRSKNAHITYRCLGRKNKHICMNKEIRREYIESYVLEVISEYLFDEKLIGKIAKEYMAYQLEINADVIMKKDTVKKRLTEVTKEIRNLITVVARTGSEMMADKISELETEKIHLEASLEQICFDESSKDISIETLTERFNQAKGLLKCGELKTTKKLIEQFVGKVVVFSDHVEVVFNFHPDLKLPQAHSTCGRDNLDIMHNNDTEYIGIMHNKNEISTCMQVDRLVEARRVELHVNSS